MSPTKLDAAPKEPASEPAAPPVVEVAATSEPPKIEMPEVTRPGYEPLRMTPEQKAELEKKITGAAGPPPPASSIPDAPKVPVVEEKAFGDMTHDEILAKYPQMPGKSIEEFTVNELIAMKTLGPALIGGALYLKSQAAVIETGAGTLGPAILSKGFTPVPFVSHINGDQ